MIVQEPVQAAIWHCLNHYDYADALFLSERLYAEVKTDESLFLLATAYYRSGQKAYAYDILKDHYYSSSPQCQYLFALCAYDLEKYHEAQAAIERKEFEEVKSKPLDDIIKDFGEHAAFALVLLGNIAAKTERKARAIESWKKALKLNPFLFSAFESLCKVGDKPNPSSIFQAGNIENMATCQGHSISNIGSVLITHNAPVNNNNRTPNNKEANRDPLFITPQQILSNCLSTTNKNIKNAKLFSPEESPLANPLCMSGLGVLPQTRHKRFRVKNDAVSSPLPSFGQIFDWSSEYNGTPSLLQPTLTESNNHLSLAKRKNTKPVFSQSSNVSLNKTPITTIPLTLQTGQNVRRSSRLFSNSYSVKENNKSPTSRADKFATPKSPSRKTKQRLAKNKNLKEEISTRNNKNKEDKEKSETITSESKTEKGAIIQESDENCLQKAILLQNQSAEGLMALLRDIGQAYVKLYSYDCQEAITLLSALPGHQFNTAWIYNLMGLAYFEKSDYESACKYFLLVHSQEPERLEYMDVYSTALWHLQKEVALSALAQDLINTNKNSPITWCVNGNCFSLHKEHDTAIKFFQRAVQVDPDFPYAYTLLGHEYITTEELDKAMSCFRNAVRLNPRHYNAWFGIGTIYSKQERYCLAEMNYSKALSINPHSSVILCHIGIVQHALQWTDKALATFNKAIENNPKSPLCKFHRGSVYFALGRHAEALQELEELKEIVPKESSVYYLIGKVHKKLGHTDLALQHFSWATDLDPKGASSQIKEAFDPAIGRGSTADNADSPASPTPDDFQLDNSSIQQDDGLNFALALPEDSEDSTFD